MTTSEQYWSVTDGDAVLHSQPLLIQEIPTATFLFFLLSPISSLGVDM